MLKPIYKYFYNKYISPYFIIDDINLQLWSGYIHLNNIKSIPIISFNHKITINVEEIAISIPWKNIEYEKIDIKARGININIEFIGNEGITVEKKNISGIEKENNNFNFLNRLIKEIIRKINLDVNEITINYCDILKIKIEDITSLNNIKFKISIEQKEFERFKYILLPTEISVKDEDFILMEVEEVNFMVNKRKIENIVKIINKNFERENHSNDKITFIDEIKYKIVFKVKSVSFNLLKGYKIEYSLCADNIMLIFHSTLEVDLHSFFIKNKKENIIFKINALYFYVSFGEKMVLEGNMKNEGDSWLKAIEQLYLCATRCVFSLELPLYRFSLSSLLVCLKKKDVEKIKKYLCIELKEGKLSVENLNFSRKLGNMHNNTAKSLGMDYKESINHEEGESSYYLSLEMLKFKHYDKKINISGIKMSKDKNNFIIRNNNCVLKYGENKIKWTKIRLEEINRKFYIKFNVLKLKSEHKEILIKGFINYNENTNSNISIKYKDNYFKGSEKLKDKINIIIDNNNINIESNHVNLMGGKIFDLDNSYKEDYNTKIKNLIIIERLEIIKDEKLFYIVESMLNLFREIYIFPLEDEEIEKEIHHEHFIVDIKELEVNFNNLCLLNASGSILISHSDQLDVKLEALINELYLNVELKKIENLLDGNIIVSNSIKNKVEYNSMINFILYILELINLIISKILDKEYIRSDNSNDNSIELYEKIEEDENIKRMEINLYISTSINYSENYSLEFKSLLNLNKIENIRCDFNTEMIESYNGYNYMLDGMEGNINIIDIKIKNGDSSVTIAGEHSIYFLKTFIGFQLTLELEKIINSLELHDFLFLKNELINIDLRTYGCNLKTDIYVNIKNIEYIIEDKVLNINNIVVRNNIIYIESNNKILTSNVNIRIVSDPLVTNVLFDMKDIIMVTADINEILFYFNYIRNNINAHNENMLKSKIIHEDYVFYDKYFCVDKDTVILVDSNILELFYMKENNLPLIKIDFTTFKFLSMPIHGTFVINLYYYDTELLEYIMFSERICMKIYQSNKVEEESEETEGYKSKDYMLENKSAENKAEDRESISKLVFKVDHPLRIAANKGLIRCLKNIKKNSCNFIIDNITDEIIKVVDNNLEKKESNDNMVMPFKTTKFKRKQFYNTDSCININGHDFTFDMRASYSSVINLYYKYIFMDLRLDNFDRIIKIYKNIVIKNLSSRTVECYIGDRNVDMDHCKNILKVNSKSEGSMELCKLNNYIRIKPEGFKLSIDVFDLHRMVTMAPEMDYIAKIKEGGFLMFAEHINGKDTINLNVDLFVKNIRGFLVYYVIIYPKIIIKNNTLKNIDVEIYSRDTKDIIKVKRNESVEIEDVAYNQILSPTENTEEEVIELPEKTSISDVNDNKMDNKENTIRLNIVRDCKKGINYLMANTYKLSIKNTKLPQIDVSINQLVYNIYKEYIIINEIKEKIYIEREIERGITETGLEFYLNTIKIKDYEETKEINFGMAQIQILKIKCKKKLKKKPYLNILIDIKRVENTFIVKIEYANFLINNTKYNFIIEVNKYKKEYQINKKEELNIGKNEHFYIIYEENENNQLNSNINFLIPTDSVGKKYFYLIIKERRHLFSVNIEIRSKQRIFTIIEENDWPVLIYNRLDKVLTFNQLDVKNKHRIDPLSMYYYTYDDLEKKRILEFDFGDKKVTNKPYFIKKSEEIKIRSIKKNHKEIIEVMGSKNKIEDEKENISFYGELLIRRLSISLIDSKEFIALHLKGVKLKLYKKEVENENKMEMKLSIIGMQIDNQEFSSFFPIILHPVNPYLYVNAKKNRNLKFLVLNFEILSISPLRLNYCVFLVQEFLLMTEEDMVKRILSFFDIENTPENIYDILSNVKKENIFINIKSLHIFPLKLRFSFMKSEKKGIMNNVLSLILKNISNLNLKFNTLILIDINVELESLKEIIINNYKSQLMYQMINIITSLDFLGNIGNLIDSFSLGIHDLFYEPYLGFISEDPTKITLGILKGSKSFIKNSLAGINNTMLKMFKSIGSVIQLATFEKTEQRIIIPYHTDKYLIVPEETSTYNPFSEIVQGIKGLIKKPITGAAKKGVKGFLQGIGKGVAGAITKPVVGIVGLTTKITEGIKEAVEERIERVEYPRVIITIEIEGKIVIIEEKDKNRIENNIKLTIIRLPPFNIMNYLNYNSNKSKGYYIFNILKDKYNFNNFIDSDIGILEDQRVQILFVDNRLLLINPSTIGEVDNYEIVEDGIKVNNFIILANKDFLERLYNYNYS